MLVIILCALMGIQFIDRLVSIIRKKKCKTSTLIISVPTLIYALCIGIYSIITKSPQSLTIVVLCICSVLSSLWCIDYVSKENFLELEFFYYFTLIAFTAITVATSIIPIVVENDKVLINSTVSTMEVIDTEDNIYAYVSPNDNDMLDITYKTDEGGYNTITGYKDDIKVIINAGIQPNIVKEQYEIVYENILGMRRKGEKFFNYKCLITVNDYSEILKSELLTGETN